MRQAVKIAVAADAANLRGSRVKFEAVEARLCDILSGGAALSQVPDTVSLGSDGAPAACWSWAPRGPSDALKGSLSSVVAYWWRRRQGCPLSCAAY